MNPYLATSLAMCGIVVIALAATAYLAASLNRRAKADLAARLTPLAEAIDGEANIDDAVVTGRYRGHLVFGRVANAPGGIGRLFHVELVDAAGGAGWEWSSLPEKGAPEPVRTFEGPADLERALDVDWDRGVAGRAGGGGATVRVRLRSGGGNGAVVAGNALPARYSRPGDVCRPA